MEARIPYNDHVPHSQGSAALRDVYEWAKPTRKLKRYTREPIILHIYIHMEKGANSNENTSLMSLSSGKLTTQINTEKKILHIMYQLKKITNIYNFLW